jgi:AcrR family transcriptional regulator
MRQDGGYGKARIDVTFEPLTPERRRAMTRQHLLEAAAIVFTRDGFHGSTLDEVAKTAGFTKGAVYSNFTSKDDLFLALVDDRMERQFAVATEVLEAGSRETSEQLPRVRELLHAGAFFWDDSWTTLYLEFVLYSRRNPEAAAKLAESARRTREFVTQLVASEYGNVGSTARYPTAHLAEISLALFNGLGIDRLVDPESVTDETIDTVLSFLYDSMGVDIPPDPPAASV